MSDEELQGDKRQHFPYIVKSNCPVCGKETIVNLRRDYLNYPTFDEEYELNFYCGDDKNSDGCYNEWSTTVLPKLVLELCKTTEEMEK